jgi:glucose/arabinose dehydrogenase/mono/diheme cytochrome c family protein
MAMAGVMIGWPCLTHALGQETGGRGAALNLPATLVSATGYSTVDAWPGLTFRQPVCIASPPGETNRAFVVSKLGEIDEIDDLSTTPRSHVFMDVAKVLKSKGYSLSTDSEQGALGLAFHPQFQTNGYLFVSYDFIAVENGVKKSFDRLSRFAVSKSNPGIVDPDSELPLITQYHPVGNHNGGDVHFGDDGYLYYSTGDGGAGNDTLDNARWIDRGFFAAICRLDVDKRPGTRAPNANAQDSTTFPSAVNPQAYSIPPDNPFVNVRTHHGVALELNKVRTEIWAVGFRNPWRFSFDDATGRLFVGNVGQDLYESIDLVEKGDDFGWSYLEGTHDGPRVRIKPADAHFMTPIFEYPHGKPADFVGNSVTGGVVYRGTRLTELYGAYIFGDFVAQRIWALRYQNGKWSPQGLASVGAGNAAFGIDPLTKDVLVVDYGGNRIRRLVRTGTQGTPPPEHLSQIGAFSDLGKLTPARGLVPYTPNVSFWSDYADKQRWFVIPDSSKKIDFSATGNWTFPAGMTWVKNFEIETRRGDPSSRRRLETRFLRKTDAGVYGITYKWRADNSDADLVPEAGQDEVLEVTVNGAVMKQTWHYPGRGECIACHSDVGGGALGFNTWQLNRTSSVGGRQVNQLRQFADAGYFSTPLPPLEGLPAHVAASDRAASAESRVRSYLAVNCSQCHQPGGAAQGLWDARPTTPTSAAGLVNGALINNGGDPAARWLVPGDPAHSMALRRITADHTARMPPLATNELDPSARALMLEWIAQTLAKKKAASMIGSAAAD